MPFWRREPDPDPVSGMRLVVGLGNPGRQYDQTRHNAGFMAVERLASRYGLQFRGSKQQADVARGNVEGVPCVLAEPLTFMNDSGRAVSSLLHYYKIELDNLFVIADDLDIPFGTLRYRPDGSSGGQRGLDSVIKSLGTSRFARLRIGVGRPRGEAVSHVLGRFSSDEERVLPQLLDIAADAVVTAVTADAQAVMNRYNRDWLDDLTAAVGS